MAFRCVDNLADAEDAVQDAFLCAWRHLDKFKGEAQMSTWLTAIVINAARLGLKRTTLIAKRKNPAFRARLQLNATPYSPLRKHCTGGRPERTRIAGLPDPLIA
jgi:DNA-directed RNA polymerase specialized sigma24 family protein